MPSVDLYNLGNALTNVVSKSVVRVEINHNTSKLFGKSLIDKETNQNFWCQISSHFRKSAFDDGGMFQKFRNIVFTYR
jgi:hypothetical protein